MKKNKGNPLCMRSEKQFLDILINQIQDRCPEFEKGDTAEVALELNRGVLELFDIITDRQNNLADINKLG